MYFTTVKKKLKEIKIVKKRTYYRNFPMKLSNIAGALVQHVCSLKLTDNILNFNFKKLLRLCYLLDISDTLFTIVIVPP